VVEAKGQNMDIKIANRSFGNVSQFRYFERTVANQNLIQEKIKRRLILVMLATIQSRNLLSSRLLSKKLKN
jgi:hypothetical protein